MRISFARTGGLVAAPGVQVRAVVTLEPSGGEVAADAGYRRVVDPQESATLIADAEAVSGTAAEGTLRGSDSRARDAYRFEFTIDTPSGVRVAVKAVGGEGSSGPPALARLVAWAAREADAIVRRRFTSA